MTCKELIFEKLKSVGEPLAIHEFRIIGHSENALAARLRELQQSGKVTSRFRKGYHYKEYFLKPAPELYSVLETGQMVINW